MVVLHATSVIWSRFARLFVSSNDTVSMADINAEVTVIPKPSMSDQLLKPIEEFQRLSQTLFLSLSGDQTARRVPPPSVSLFIECDAQMSRALDVARTHQIKQRKIETLKQEILDLDAQWRHICSELEAGKQELETMIKDGDERIESIEKAKYGQFTFIYSVRRRVNQPMQPPCRILNSSHTLKVSARSLLLRRTCRT